MTSIQHQGMLLHSLAQLQSQHISEPLHRPDTGPFFGADRQSVTRSAPLLEGGGQNKQAVLTDFIKCFVCSNEPPSGRKPACLTPAKAAAPTSGFVHTFIKGLVMKPRRGLRARQSSALCRLSRRGKPRHLQTGVFAQPRPKLLSAQSVC